MTEPKEQTPKKPRALVVDDDPIIRLLASKALRQIDFEVEEADNGRAALDAAARTVPDLILLDLEMANVDGFKTCRELRARYPDVPIPIIVATGLTDSETIERVFEMGATDFTKKPIDWQLLQHQVRFVMRANEAISRVDEARQVAEAASRAKLDFLANMSHEIRTPMTAIVGFLRELHGADADALSKQERADAVEAVQRNADHLLRLIDDMLDVSRIDSGKIRVELGSVDVAKLIGEVVEELRPQAVRAGLQLMCPAARRRARMTTDRLRLRQILNNLITNAIKFTDAGTIAVRVRQVQGAVEIGIEDSGIGMTEDQIDLAFEPLTQVNESMVRSRGGAGLGLSIVKRLVEALQGTIQLSSVPGQGTTVLLVLPDLDEDDETLSSSPTMRTNPGQALEDAPTTFPGARILFVEDGPDNRRLVNLLLTKLGAECALAENGRLGVDAAMAAKEREPFDLILMDMQMPVLDGYDATRELRSKGYEGPIVALTAHAMSGDRERCLEAGCDDYQAKPVTRKQLADVLAAWVGKSAS